MFSSQELEAAKEAERMKVEKVLEYDTIYNEGYSVPGFKSVLLDISYNLFQG